jgi:hypothetical protein
MKKIKTKNNRGFAILFAVTLSSIVLGIALGVVNISLKEIKFGTSARSTNDAFFAADTGIECALANDKSTSESFIEAGEPFVYCLGGEIVPEGSYPFFEFVISGLGSAEQSCAKISVLKTEAIDQQEPPVPATTTIISKGYDTGDESCDSVNPDRIEREIKITY